METVEGRVAAGTTGRRRALAVVGVMVVVAIGGACSRGAAKDVAASDATASGEVVTATGAARDAGVAATAAGAAPAGGAGSGVNATGSASVGNAGPDTGASIPPTLGRSQIVRTASLEVEVERNGFAAAFSKVPTIAAANGGFVASSSSVQGSGGRAAAGTLEVRVPSDKFDEARRQLAGLGDLRSEQLRGEDAGGKLTDLDARLRNLRSQEEAMRLLMTKTGTVGETIEVQRQLSTVREQIEQLAGEQARLQDAVAYSTLTVALVEPGGALQPDEGSPLAGALGRAVDGAERVLTAVIVALGYLVPLALLAATGWMLVRVVSGRRRPAVVSPPAS